MDWEDFYFKILRIRRTEEKIVQLYPTDVVKSPVHLSIGQEFISVAICAALNVDDIAFGTYRSHALFLAKGGDIRAMWAELFGKVGGMARGRAGSMHLGDPAVNMVGTSAIVATSIPNAVGYALAEKIRGSGRIVVAFFGDGATDEGVFHESLNFASLKKLPILFVCENNSYAIYSHVHDRMPAANFIERAAGYLIPGTKVDDGTIDAVYFAARDAIDRVRRGAGPAFLECACSRWLDHVGPGSDVELGYRSLAELESWQRRDEVARVAGMLDESSRRQIERAVDDELADALIFAHESPFPDPTEVERHVFA
ncbi:thiamine pyrophosphate-dependent dehydrogenase E1 component subunit alpha [Thalassobaculum sp.]|uniref:thiamine pyrophosphate-dependent dehydrogenase E1 component subunit alpha n=1 Tax=Thalassobaculum sp. TaxID=2022740 RepID=UPI0032EC7855